LFSTQAMADTVKSASELDYPPFSIVLDDGSASGFSVELMRESLHMMGRTVTYEVRPWAEIKHDLEQGNLEALPLVGRTPEREKAFDFTIPYLKLYGAVFVRNSENNIKNITDLSGRRVAVLKGDNAEEFLRRNNITDQLITLSSFEGAFLQLFNGKVDAVVAQRIVGLNLIEKLKLNNIKTAIAPLKELRQDFCFAVTKGNTQLLSDLNEGLSIVIANKTYDRLYTKWLGILNREKEKVYLIWITISAVSVLLIIILLCLYFYQKIQALKKLKASEEHLRISQLYGNIGTWEADLISNKEIWSEAVTDILGFPKVAEPTWDIFLQVIHPDDREQVVSITNAHINEGLKCDVEYRIIDPQGKIRWMRSIGKAEFDSNGKPLKLRGTVQEITDLKKAEEQLLLISKVFSETMEGIVITDINSIILNVNPAFCDITGYSRNEAIGQKPSILSSGKQTPEFYLNMWQNLSKYGNWQGEVWNRKKDGNVYAELLSISSIVDENNQTVNYIGIFTDITLSKKQQEALEKMAHYDVLTQLPNRVLLIDRFNQALAHCKRKDSLLAVCFLDLDNFKPVNDSYGHAVGDELLIEVAIRIKKTIRNEDTVSRQGGDEFALLLGDIDTLYQCEQMLERIIRSVSLSYEINEQSISISASIGVSLYPVDDSDLDTLMRHADQAMYQAKLAGRNRYYFFNAEEDNLTTKKHIQLNEIEQALYNNEFSLFYQPKVNMATGKVFGAEALIRWNHPDKGLIMPLNFLPIIEDTELEALIGSWVVNEALKQLNCWLQQGIELEISVNISSFHLQQVSFISDLEAALALYPKLDSHLLQLEILESSALGELALINAIIKKCMYTVGVNIALDDFGTGYSSLTHLKNLPANTIKIDQSFVRDMLDDPDDYAIIEGIIGLANSFNRKVIAEGVETIEHGLILLSMGCKEAQGFGISKPMPAVDFPAWLNNYKPIQEWGLAENKISTDKDNKLELLRLTFNQWQKHFKKNIESPAENIENWPIMQQNKCHCGIWIERAKQEKLFDEKWIIQLVDTHKTMHYVADDLFKQYQQGKVESAREKLKSLTLIFDKINCLFIFKDNALD